MKKTIYIILTFWNMHGDAGHDIVNAYDSRELAIANLNNLYRNELKNVKEEWNIPNPITSLYYDTDNNDQLESFYIADSVIHPEVEVSADIISKTLNNPII